MGVTAAQPPNKAGPQEDRSIPELDQDDYKTSFYEFWPMWLFYAPLKLYALYKQGTSGDASGKRPGRFNMVARAKYDAWAGLQGTSKDDAMEKYIKLVSDLG